MRLLSAFLAVIFSFSIAASARAQSAGNQPNLTDASPAAEPGNEKYILGPGDMLIVRATNVPELTEKPIRIDLNGMINLPVAGRTQAGGLTIEALEAEVTKRLKVFLQEPDVSITVTEFQSQPVSVFGEVMAPGVHQLQGRKTLVELLALTGGLKPEAGPTVRITRRLDYGRLPLPGATDDASGQFSVAELDLKPLVQAKTPEKDIRILPYDIISIPKAELVYIAGDVTKSGAVTLNDRSTISIMEALSSTGGVTKTSEPKKARILRLVAGSPVRAQLPVDISKIMNGKENDVELTAGDILFVPSSNARKATLRMLEAALQAGTVILGSGVVNGTL